MSNKFLVNKIDVIDFFIFILFIVKYLSAKTCSRPGNGMERSGRPLSREGRFDSPFIRGYLAVLESIIDQTGAFMGVDDSHRHSVTLKDIAAMADVSSMTVSNFINGKFHAMSAETREKLGKSCRSTRIARMAARGTSVCREPFPSASWWSTIPLIF